MRYSVVIAVPEGFENELRDNLAGVLYAVRDYDAEVVVVGGAGCADAVRDTDAVLVEIVGAQGGLCHLMNVGHRSALGETLVSMEVDGEMACDFMACVDYDVSHRSQLIGFFPRGRIAVARTVFDSVRGYDESFKARGYEAADLFERARASHDADIQVAKRTLYPGREDEPGALANSQASVKNMRAKRFAVNPEGFGRATVKVGFSDKEQVIE